MSFSSRKVGAVLLAVVGAWPLWSPRADAQVTPAYPVNYAYDKAGRLIKVWVCSTGISNMTAQYSYDADGNITGVTTTHCNGCCGGGAVAGGAAAQPLSSSQSPPPPSEPDTSAEEP